MKLLSQIEQNLEKWVMRCCLAAICVTLMLQVVMRYVFQSALAWPEELSRYLFIVSVFFSIGYTVRNKTMLKVEFVVGLLPKGLQTAIGIFGQGVTLAVFSYLTVSALQVIAEARQTMQLSAALRLPMYVLYAVAAIGFALAVIRSVQMIVRYIQGGEGT